MAITVTTITDFLTLVGPLFTVMQGLAYLSYIVIAVAIVGANLSAFFIAALKFVQQYDSRCIATLVYNINQRG